MYTQVELVPSNSPWMRIRDGNRDARKLYQRHYSYRAYRDGRDPAKMMGPGEYVLLVTPAYDAIFGWRKFIDASGQVGVNCSIFRNESPHLSSHLILEAEKWAVDKWPGERMYTYVNPRSIRSSNPGYCFFMAGWRRCGTTKGGLTVLEKIIPLEETWK